ncbi:13340_t:CDS:1, partial [Funneliformis mosseae]
MKHSKTSCLYAILPKLRVKAKKSQYDEYPVFNNILEHNDVENASEDDNTKNILKDDNVENVSKDDNAENVSEDNDAKNITPFDIGIHEKDLSLIDNEESTDGKSKTSSEMTDE